MMKTKHILFKYLFKFLCITLFICQAWSCLDAYIHQEPVTRSVMIRQEEKPLPLICIGARFGYYENNLNITAEEYENGRWKAENMTETETFDILSPKLYDLIDTLEF